MLDTSFINDLSPELPIALCPTMTLGEMGRGLYDLFRQVTKELCEGRNGLFSWRASDLVSFSSLLCAKAYASAVLIATSQGFSWPENKSQGALCKPGHSPAFGIPCRAGVLLAEVSALRVDFSRLCLQGTGWVCICSWWQARGQLPTTATSRGNSTWLIWNSMEEKILPAGRPLQSPAFPTSTMISVVTRKRLRDCWYHKSTFV